MLSDLGHAAGKCKHTTADWFIKRARLLLKVSAHSSRQREPLSACADENANETFYHRGVVDCRVPSMNWTEPAVCRGLWLCHWKGESSELSTSSTAACHVLAVWGIWAEWWRAWRCVIGIKKSTCECWSHQIIESALKVKKNKTKNPNLFRGVATTGCCWYHKEQGQA